MSEKITFKELIESIAEETDKSRQSTQDFVKNFVEVISEGLEEDGKVNIAGFGKFNLKHVDEREGYNPQTEENITIPARNKVVFKPYKDVREKVNAPYAHLEPTLLHDKDEEDQKIIEEDSTDPADNKQSDFIPTAPPTTETTDKTSENISDSTEEEDEDIVEFKPDNSDTDEEVDEELNNYLRDPAFFDDEKTKAEDEKSVENEENQEQSEDEKKYLEEAIFQNEELFNDFEDPSDSFNNADKNQEKNDSEQHTRRANKKSSSLPIMIAAVVILLLTAGGVWYFSTTSGENQSEMITQQTLSSSENISVTADEQPHNEEHPAGEQQPSQNLQQTDQAQNPNTGSSTASDRSSATVSSENTSEGVTIEQGQTLWSLAEEKYGNPRLWPWIYGTNDSIENPDVIYAGSSLSLPLPSGPNNSLNASDSVGVAKGFIATYHWYKDQNSSKAKNHLWGAKVYHDDIRDIADVEIDKADLKYANRAR